jgi:hypothetical protein
VLPALSRFEFGLPELPALEKASVLGAEHRLVVLHLGISFSRHADLLRLELGQDLLLHLTELVVGLEPASGVIGIARVRRGGFAWQQLVTVVFAHMWRNGRPAPCPRAKQAWRALDLTTIIGTMFALTAGIHQS